MTGHSCYEQYAACLPRNKIQRPIEGHADALDKELPGEEAWDQRNTICPCDLFDIDNICGCTKNCAVYSMAYDRLHYLSKGELVPTPHPSTQI